MALDPKTQVPKPIDARTGQLTRLFSYLPGIFQETPLGVAGPLPLGRLLMAFESIFLGLAKTRQSEWVDLQQPGLEEILGGAVDESGAKQMLLAGIERYFDPVSKLPGQSGLPEDNGRAPAEFLSWLAGWVALTLREDWDSGRKRDFIANAVR